MKIKGVIEFPIEIDVSQDIIKNEDGSIKQCYTELEIDSGIREKLTEATMKLLKDNNIENANKPTCWTEYIPTSFIKTRYKL